MAAELTPRSKGTRNEAAATSLNWVRAARRRGRPSSGGPGDAPGIAGSGRGDSCALQSRISERFVEEQGKFYFRDGRVAFRDHGGKLSTPSENPEIIGLLMEIADSRGWQQVKVEGSNGFCRQAWRQGRLIGLVVGGYKPSATEHTSMIRARSAADRFAHGITEQVPDRPVSTAGAVQRDKGPTAGLETDAKEVVAGMLLVHGMESYRSNPRKGMSYFIRIGTDSGPRTVWAKDLRRAMEQSRTQPKIGDQVVLRRVPSDRLPSMSTSSESQARGEGDSKGPTRRQGWVIEKRDFLEARIRAAATFRDVAIDPLDGVRQHPELAGCYFNLHAAKLAAQKMPRHQDRSAFVFQVRSRMADSIEQGEPFPLVRLRARPDGQGQPDLGRGNPPTR